MGGTIGDILPVAIGVALSPIPIVAVILMLFTKRARSNSLAFLVGWIGGLVVVGGIVLAVAGGTDVTSENGGESTFSGVVKLVLGVLLLALAVRNWQKRPKGDEEPPTPRWMAAIDDFTATKSLGMGIVFSGVNPKNLALTLAAAATISASGLSNGSQVIVLAVFVVLASVSVAAPVATYVVLGDRANATLSDWKGWLIRNNSVVMAVLLLVLAAKLIGDALKILT